MATRSKSAKAAARSARKPAGARSKSGSRKRLKSAAAERGLAGAEIALPREHPDLSALVALVGKADGAVIGAYRDPLGGRALLVATLPLKAVQPTPFQRDLSPTHTKRLAEKIDQAGAFLDPLIVVQGQDGQFWTPNGRHRLAAAKVLGLRQITALICPDEALAYRILALNTEKAHNLRDKSLEVIRMARNLAKRQPTLKESGFAAQFESAELLTLGILYEKVPRFGGGAYSSFLKKVDRLSDKPLAASLRERADHAARLGAIDAAVKRIVEALQKRGMKSPYLRSYVVARINPVRFHKVKPGDKKPVMPIAQALTRMTAAARQFDLEKVSMSDLAWVAAGAESSD